MAFVLGCGGESASTPTDSRPEMKGTASDSGGATPSGRCQFPRLRLAYLPWLPKGQPVPEPSRERFEGYAQLDWHDGMSYVLLWRVNETLGGPGELAPSLPNGAEGYLYAGSSDEDVAQWAIVWGDARADGCNQTTLSLYSPTLTKQEGKQEILGLASTLTESP